MRHAARQQGRRADGLQASLGLLLTAPPHHHHTASSCSSPFLLVGMVSVTLLNTVIENGNTRNVSDNL